MEKIIELIMDESKNITVKVSNECLEIPKECRTIKADAIYKLLDYKRGDKYIVKSINKKNFDRPAFAFFVELFEEITGYLNGLSENGDYIESEDEEKLNTQYNNDVPFDEEVPF